MLYFITSNSGKFREISAVLPDVKQLRLDLDEIQSLDPHAVIEHKLNQAAALHKGAILVEDTSLELSCLKGLPGTLVKSFEQTLGIEGIAALAMKYEDRLAIAKSTIGYRSDSGVVRYFEGVIEGHIIPPQGDLNNFGWNSIFKPLGFDRTFAEMSVEEKNHISMRGLAAKKLLAHISG
jgi:non-canonical purine NTP pyrophosphatase (RdgB/HAM1 family)